MRLCLLYCAPASLVAGVPRTHRVYGKYVDGLAEHFEEVVVCNTFAPFPVIEAQYEFRAPNVSIEVLPYFARVADSWRVLLRCAQLIWRGSRRWDLLYLTLPSPLGIIGFLCARMRGIPVVLDIEGDLSQQYEVSRYPGLAGWSARMAVKVFEALTRFMSRRAVTVTQGEALLRKYGGGGQPSVSVPWSSMPEKAIVERRDACCGSPVRLLFVGTMLEKKGIFVLLDAIKLLRSRLSTCLVTYVGAGPQEGELRRRVLEAGLAEVVEVKGGIYGESDVLREFDAADIFVFPSYAEGFPRVIFEAMARGLPVVSTEVSGIPFLLKSGRDALLVPPGSPEDVAEAIVRIICDPQLREGLIRNGRELSRRYTLEATTRRRAAVIRLALT